MLSLEQQDRWRGVYAREHPGWRPATEEFAARVRSVLSPDARLLDLGCGRGGLVEQLDHTKSGSVGVDPDLVSLQEHRLAGFLRAQAPSGALPFAPGAFDVVIASWLLEHLQNPSNTLAEVSRVLRTGGQFIFITPNGRHPLNRINRFAGRPGRFQGQLVARLYGRTQEDTFPTIYDANSREQLAKLATVAGLTLRDLTFVADPSYLAFNKLLFRIMSQLDDRLPVTFRVHLVGVMQKPIA
ncbi:MAG TPA: class I SAM-dependent methyltransferase [Promineifilum sp.]